MLLLNFSRASPGSHLRKISAAFPRNIPLGYPQFGHSVSARVSLLIIKQRYLPRIFHALLYGLAFRIAPSIKATGLLLLCVIFYIIHINVSKIIDAVGRTRAILAEKISENCGILAIIPTNKIPAPRYGRIIKRNYICFSK